MSTCGHLLKGMMDKASRTLTRVMIQKSRAGEGDGNNGGAVVGGFFPFHLDSQYSR